MDPVFRDKNLSVFLMTSLVNEQVVRQKICEWASCYYCYYPRTIWNPRVAFKIASVEILFKFPSPPDYDGINVWWMYECRNPSSFICLKLCWFNSRGSNKLTVREATLYTNGIQRIKSFINVIKFVYSATFQGNNQTYFLKKKIFFFLIKNE